MEETALGPPRSFPIVSLQQLGDRSYFSSANFEFNKSSVPLQKTGGTSSEKRPRLLACHDLKGGYLDDQWIQGSQNADAYTLTHWRLLDIFVYFSHKLVTLPPPGWTNAAHRHGVQVLGTFITEWAEGASVCQELLASKESLCMYADRLAELAEALGFDGWLINVENVIAKAQIADLQEFVRHLTVRMHSILPGSVVIWYDSVTTEGKLAWQNTLNALNKPFFDCCDGILINYAWKSDYPKLSASVAGDRAHDVYMGVDVFGRGSFGGGQFQCDVALRAVRQACVSAALFAPAWAYETNQDESRWWESIGNCWPAARPDPIQLPFFTDFDLGRGVAKCIESKQVSYLPWNNLSCQNLQPILHVASAGSDVQFMVTASQECAVYSGGVCIKAVGDVGHDEVCIVQLYNTETTVDEAILNVSYSVKAGADSSFALALTAQDSKGSKLIYFLLDSKDGTGLHSFPKNHHFSHVSAVFEHVNENHISATTRNISTGGDSQNNDSLSLDPVVPGGKWTVREFTLKWGNSTLVDIFGICSAAKDLRPILVMLLRENETLFDRERFAAQVRRRSTEQQSDVGRRGSTSPDKSTPSFSDEERSTPTATYLGMTTPVNNATFALPVPPHESGHYVRTQPSLSDWLFKELH